MKTFVLVLVLVAIVALGWWAWSRGLFREVQQAFTPPAPPRELGAAAPGGSSTLGALYGSGAAAACNYATSGKGGQLCAAAGDAGAAIGEEVNTALPDSGIVRTVAVSNPVVAGHIYVGKKAYNAVKGWF
jgi:hypothetical protein